MKAKLIVEGKEFEVELNSVEVKKLIKSERKTGYERVGKNQPYTFVDADGILNGYDTDEYDDVDDVYYEQANYYSEVAVAENNARADKLMRQLRRFAAELRENNIDWDREDYKYYIRFGHGNNSIYAASEAMGHPFGMIVFDSEKACNLAIETFRDELIWYFTEYKDSL